MGIEGVASRIAEIQSRILAMRTQPAQVTATLPASTAFAAYLDDAVAAQAPATTASAGAPSAMTRSASARLVAVHSAGLNSQGIPADLAAYGNGKVPASALEQVGATGQRLWAPAAEALTRLTVDAKAAGVTIGITDSYRSYAAQVDLAQRKGLYSQGGLAARPGTSEHGWGLAADLDLNGPALTWMRANAGRYGFDDDVARESWHWAYKPQGPHPTR
ncbi:MAG: zinc D-Ala-D-Ala carboxypeptidase [Actinoplanes sp.]|nr:zinc D-Ala-D-Ala carboxypeptidase [Actinoplanes sp.]